MTDSLFIRLAGPLQSWAGPAITGNIVRTDRFPTHSGLIGLLAGTLGAKRGEFPTWLSELEFYVREERPPTLIDEYQTIGFHPDSALFRQRLLAAHKIRSNTKKAITFTPDAGGGTSIVNRTYLADGEFLVRITAGSHTDELERALRQPAFVTYMGRKAFAPEFPFYLGRGDSDLIDQIPVPPKVTRHFRDAPAPRRPVFVRIYGPYQQPEGTRLQLEVSVAEEEERIETIRKLLARN